MANIILPPGWRIPEREATPESVYWNRKAFLRSLGLGAAGLAVGSCSSASFTPTELPDEPSGDCNDRYPEHPLQTVCASPVDDLYPAAQNPAYTLGRPQTERLRAATTNNFYEFTEDAGRVWRLTGPYRVEPWTVEIAGEAHVTGTFDVEELAREFGLEERLYRHRCVETWAMAVPWTGYPLAKLIEKARPFDSARYVRFVSFLRPEEAVGQQTREFYPWPYYEGFRLDEAMNELAFVVTGIYGEPLPKQHGAPLRLAMPWKYGYKSPKAFVRIVFERFKPNTFWNDVAPDEYGFFSNVNPGVPHPRWSQARETMLGETFMRPTVLFNGYGDWVADLYDPELLTYRS